MATLGSDVLVGLDDEELERKVVAIVEKMGHERESKAVFVLKLFQILQENRGGILVDPSGSERIVDLVKNWLPGRADGNFDLSQDRCKVVMGIPAWIHEKGALAAIEAIMDGRFAPDWQSKKNAAQQAAQAAAYQAQIAKIQVLQNSMLQNSPTLGYSQLLPSGPSMTAIAGSSIGSVLGGIFGGKK